jgi:ATP-binding cassette subfamily B protein
MKLPLQRYWRLLSHYLRPQWRQMLLLGVLILLHIGLRLLNPQMMRDFIDTAAAGGSLNSLVRAALLFFGIALLIQALSVANTFLGESVAWQATNALRLSLLRHVLELDQSFHKQYTAGELLERIDGDVNNLSNFFSRFTVYLLGNVLLMIGVLIFLFREDWRVGSALSLFAVVALFVMIRIRTVAIPYWKAFREQSAHFFGFLGEQLAGTEDVRANGAVGYVLRRFDQIMQGWFPIRRRASLLGGALWSTNLLLFALANAVVFALSLYLWQRALITLGGVYLLIHYTELLRQPMTQLRNQIEDLQKAEASIQRVEALLATTSKVKDNGREVLPAGPLSVEFEAVEFGYDELATVLHGVSFRLAPGRVLGLLGRTGSGKTTLARLLLRLYDPDSGQIGLAGVRPSAVSLHHLRQRVGLVTQDVHLFQGTVRENLTFFNPAIADEQLLAALTGLGLRPWLERLPDGLDTVLASGGASLSAGQAQLLAFARVFLADPGLVILDEASSRLDPATEHLVERAVGRLLQQRTGVIIAHHLATVERADEILILDGGKVLEYGPRAALAADPNSHFYRLLQSGLEEVLV